MDRRVKTHEVMMMLALNVPAHCFRKERYEIVVNYRGLTVRIRRKNFGWAWRCDAQDGVFVTFDEARELIEKLWPFNDQTVDDILAAQGPPTPLSPEEEEKIECVRQRLGLPKDRGVS